MPPLEEPTNDFSRLILQVLSFSGLPEPAPADLAVVARITEGRRESVRALDAYVQRADPPVEPLTTPNWTPDHD